MKAELVVIPSPGVGHIVSTLEIAKLLVDRDDRLSITVLLMKSPFDPKATTDVQSIAASCATDRIRFIELPDLHRDDESDQENKPKKSFSSLLEEQKPHVKEAVAKRALSDSPRLAGFVVDMFCTTMIDVADEFGLPSYVFFTSGAAFLGLLLHLQALHDEQNVDVTEFKDSDAELAVPSLVNPLPAKVLPSSFLSKEWVPYLFGHARKFREANGIMVNTFFELESRALTSISDGKIPPVFPVGPLLNLKGDHGTGDAGKAADIMEWLDDQPQSSVVFLCFGSMGSFDEVQVKEIACALEQSGYRFYLAFIASAALGGLIAATQLIGALANPARAAEVPEILKGLGIDIGAVSIFAFLYARDNRAKNAQIARLSREESLSNLKLRVDEKRIISVSTLRGAARLVICAGPASFIEESFKCSEPFTQGLLDRGVLVVPYPTDGNTPSFEFEETEETKEITARRKRLWQLAPVYVSEWSKWLEEQKNMAGVSPESPVYLSLRMDGRVRGSGVGYPPWNAFVAQLPPVKGIWSGLLDGMDGRVL